MRLILATPLYPPDIAAPAAYVKELAKRLAKDMEVVVVTYGRLPERVPGAKIIAIDKRRVLPLRVFWYTLALMRAARGADALYIQNGPSVELPATIVSLLIRRPLFAHIGDRAAHEYAARHGARRALERLVLARAHLVADTPPERPEILPLEPRPDAALATWEQAWSAHVKKLEAQLHGH